MNPSDISKTRLASQGVAGTKFNSAKKVLKWMGAIQAQDYAMALWAVGIRLGNSTEKEISAAIDKGEILRTHLLRPTWHLVSSDDIYPLLELTAPQIKRSFKSRHEELGLSTAVLRKCNHVIERVLIGGNHLTREELIVELGKAKIATDQNRASHIFAWAELEGMIVSGASKGGKPTYALLEERVPKKTLLNRDETLEMLANTYFSSRYPATLRDFIWWSGLSVRDATHGLDLAKQLFSPQTINSQTYWVPASLSISRINDNEAYLLPAFDEFIISYSDRSAALPPDKFIKAVSNNGMFRPVIVTNGRVIGIWKRSIKKDNVLVEAELFELSSKVVRDRIEKASGEYGRYLEKKADLTFKS